jgi:hypothetical protein
MVAQGAKQSKATSLRQPQAVGCSLGVARSNRLLETMVRSSADRPGCDCMTFADAGSLRRQYAAGVSACHAEAFAALEGLARSIERSAEVISAQRAAARRVAAGRDSRRSAQSWRRSATHTFEVWADKMRKYGSDLTAESDPWKQADS